MIEVGFLGSLEFFAVLVEDTSSVSEKLKKGGMDPGDYKSELRQTRSFSRTSSTGSSLRHRSLRFLGAPPFLLDEDTVSEIVSEAGDIGDRALSSNRQSESSSFRYSLDNALESGVVALDPENESLQLSGFWSNGAKASNAVSSVSPLPEEIISPMSTDAIVHTCDKKHVMTICTHVKEQQDKIMELPKLLEYMLCLVHLAVFGIFGVLTRYLLQKLFGPGVARVTSDHSILYLDLPSNMVGSFLMGWFGVVFKGDISSVSEFLAIGLSTGYLGSLTTFSGWNQKMLDASVNGHWVFSVLEFLLGLFLVGYSIIFGIETAKGFRWLLMRLHTSSKSETTGSVNKWRINSRQGHWVVLIVLMLLLAFLWSLSGTLLGKEFNSHNSGAQLWLACVVGPFGVWIRWFLARLNGRGIGRTGILKWVPFGTLIANVSAACVMAALSTLREAVNTSACSTIVTGVQFGFLGCLSTVSTFAAEFHAMRESRHPWRAYVYTLITVGVSFGLGTLIYSVPVWTKGYN